MGSFLRNWREMRRFRRLPRSARDLVFYAEDGGSWAHFQPIVRELVDGRGREIVYLTSSPHDPILAEDHPQIHAFDIGDGTVRTILFAGLDATVMVMTMPDLETFHIKRSKMHQVRYAYVFHSLVSTHMIYRKGAFDHFDTVLCSGPHHVAELRATESHYGLKPKELVEHGYGRLDMILAERGEAGTYEPSPSRHVLIAPSWGPDGVIETMGEELVRMLLAAGFQVCVRPHPETLLRTPGIVNGLVATFGAEPGFSLDRDMASSASLHASDIMISDWSGAALEFAFGLERPVLFIAVPRKVRNDEYTSIGLEPLEVSIRGEIGEVVSPEDLDEVAPAIERLCADPDRFRDRIRQARHRHVFNVGESGRFAADHLEQLVEANR